MAAAQGVRRYGGGSNERATSAPRVTSRTQPSMQRGSRPPGRSFVGVAVAATLLAACSSPDEDAHTEVAGVVLEHEADAADEAPDGPPEEADDRPAGPMLLRSGPVATGTVWLSAAGEWVGLDGQVLDLDSVPAPVHLDAVVETTDDGATLEGCKLRIVAPEDAELEAVGVLTIDLVVEHATGEPSRVTLEPVDLDVHLAPGDDVAVDVTAPDGDAIALDADLDAQARCEGRFDRT